MPTLSIEIMEAILRDVEYPSAKFVLRASGSTFAPYLQVEFDGCCNLSGVPMTWRGRKWGLSYYMTKSEVVQTAFLALLTALEHETREKFMFKGRAVFGPHFDIERLVTLASDPNNQDVRMEPPKPETTNEADGMGV